MGSSRADEAALWRAFRERGCERARAALIERYRYLAEMTVDRVVPRVPARIEREDLVAEGLVALVTAVDRFDPARGVKFSSMAISFIRGAMLEYLRQEDWVPRSVRQRQKSGEDVAVLSLVSLETIREEREGAEDLTLLESIADPAPGPEELVLAAAARESVREAVAALSHDRAAALTSYYYEERTWKEIAHEMGKSESRLHQYGHDGLARLRQYYDERAEEREMVEGGRGRRPAWTAADDDRLKEMYGQHKGEEIALALGRTLGAVQTRIHALGLASSSPLSQAIRATLRARREAGKDEAMEQTRNGHAPVVAEEPGEEPHRGEPVRAVEERVAAVPWVQAPAIRGAPFAPAWVEQLDPEIAVMADVARQLAGLEDRARTRVLRWLADRYGLWK